MRAMIVSRMLAVGGLGLLLLLGTGCPSGITEDADDAGVDVAQQDRGQQQDAPPFFEDANAEDGGTPDGTTPGDGPVQSDGTTGDGGPCYPEPDETTGGDTCADALDRGTVDFTTTTHVTVSGNLWPAADVDWYKVIFKDDMSAANCGKFKARISFSQNPGDHFRFDVLSSDCTSQATCQTVTAGDAGVDLDGGMPTGGLTNYSLDGLPACPCAVAATPSPTSDTVKLCNDYSVELRVRVFRKTGAPIVCENYELSIDNS